jgi:hypothetical protein
MVIIKKVGIKILSKTQAIRNQYRSRGDYVYIGKKKPLIKSGF